MLSLWRRAIDTSKALLLDEIDLGPDALLEKVEEFEGLSQVTEHSYPAIVLSGGEDGTGRSGADPEGLHKENQSENAIYGQDDGDGENDGDEYYLSDLFEGAESSVPLG